MKTQKRKDKAKIANAATANGTTESATITEKTMVKLADFVENPDNPSTATEEEIARLAGKLKRVPLGLTAMRIAYVTDHTDGDLAGRKVVISGNKRLRCLKAAFGEDGKVPAEWFADVTAMSEEERHEFIVSANVSDGSWDLDKLLAQYDREELYSFGLEEEFLESLYGSSIEGISEIGDDIGYRDECPPSTGNITIQIPPDKIPLWRSYNRRHGKGKVVEFVLNLLNEEFKDERDA